MQFWLNYSDKRNRLERTPVAVKNIDRLFCMDSEILESDNRCLLLFSDIT